MPLVVATFATLDKRVLGETTAVFHFYGILGAASSSHLAHHDYPTGTSNYTRMTEFVTPFNELLAFPQYLEMWDAETMMGLARIAVEVQQQANMIGFLNAFGIYTVASAAVIPFVWMVRMPKRTGGES